MARPKSFSVLLITDSQNKKVLEPIMRLVKRHFTNLYLARDADQAIEVIRKQGVDVVLFGLGDVQAAEVCFLHMIRSDRTIEDKVAYTMVLCGKDQIQNAFNICNKDIFNDYFVCKPLYDPHHMLLRLRTIRRLLSSGSLKRSTEISVDDMCDFFDKVATSGKELVDINDESLARLINTVTLSMESIKARMRDEQPNNPRICADSVNAIIDDHTANTLMPKLKQGSQESQDSVSAVVDDLVTQGESQKSSLQQEVARNLPSAVSVMVVEDEDADLQQISNDLLAAGFNVHASPRATIALQNLEEWLPRIAIIDLTLPDMSALHVISRVQNHPRLKDTRIMALAKPGDKDRVMEAVKMGINEVMVKPVDKDMLMYKINYNLTNG